MRRVNRPGETPQHLTEKGQELTEALLGEIARLEAQGKKLKTSSPFFNKYDKPDIRKALEKMYNKYCCYCEQSVGQKGEIEHLKPRSTYPEETYLWENLHLACSDCNRNKSSKYNIEHPIIPPTSPLIETDIKKRVRPQGIKYEALTDRGRTTIDHPKLNRDDLVTVRTEVFHEAIDLIFKVKDNPNNPNVPDINAELDTMEKGPFGSVVTYARKAN